MYFCYFHFALTASKTAIFCFTRLQVFTTNDTFIALCLWCAGTVYQDLYIALAIFKNVFDVYNLSVMSNLFDIDKPYALSTHIIKNVRTKCIIFREAFRIRVKKFEQNLRENYSKSTKIVITACKFSKNFRRSMPSDPPRAFLVSQSASN